MQARIVLNIFLLLLILGLAAYLTRTDAPIPAGQESITLSTIDPVSVNHIQVSRPGKPDLVLQKSGTDWHIVSPIQAVANTFRTSSLLALLQSRSLSTVSADPASFGLANNQVTVTFDNHVFRFGNINPMDNSRYVLHNDIIHLVEDTLYDQLLQDAAFFADNRLLPIATSVVRIKLAELEIAYINNSWIQVSGTNQIPVATITAMAARWHQLEATRVTTAAATSAAVDIILETDTGALIEIATLAENPELLLQRIDTGTVYHFPAQTAVDLGIIRTAN